MTRQFIAAVLIGSCGIGAAIYRSYHASNTESDEIAKARQDSPPSSDSRPASLDRSSQEPTAPKPARQAPPPASPGGPEAHATPPEPERSLIGLNKERVIAQDSSPVQSSQEGKVTDGLQLLIDTEKDIVVQDEPIVLNFHWKNFRQQTVDTVAQALNAYSIEVIDGSGRRLLSKEEGRRKQLESTGEVAFKFVGSFSYVSIEPGDEQKNSMDLGKAYSLSPGTTYSIRAKRNVERLDGNGLVTVVSNRIVVTVLQ